MRIQAIVIRIIRQFFRDKRTLGLMVFAPMFVLLLLNLVFNGEEYKATIGVDETVPSVMVEKLEKQNITVQTLTAKEANRQLEKQQLDAFIEMDGQTLNVKLEGSDPTVNKAVMASIQKAFQPLAPQAQSIQLKTTYLHGFEDMELFDYFGPVLIGFFIFFFVFLIAGVSFLRERTSGTLERLLATPLKRWEMVVGYIIGFGIFATLQASLISWFAIDILDMVMEGSFFYVLLITFLLAMTALTLGTLLSAFANNELQMLQFIPLVVVPQIFFSGLFNLDTMSEWLRSLSVVMPLKYGADALREIMIRGNGWNAIAKDVYVLLSFSFLFAILNVVALRKYRKL
ncbi:ABC-2 type transport system permease protein [Thermolongibacillus altinsuensis]|jgi:ABC-2 type transport system permease protein|uniref:ABC-2 type transport system permease protein n=1 Tax=Thermolongibacillus altinsuensis TaxID=575256 RepID=A0A4R1QBA0_9BACL|nr:ABC transporter permease [Thermolongibacillus altinsuensis]TCL46822.1 ABC-2 type transport system permease protein [Thermolongibacillus altinsuensis]GMB09245.1 transport permease protein [Thermolongibacillus altinsuensis]